MTSKVVIPNTSSKHRQATRVHRAPATPTALTLSCGMFGTEGNPFLVATAYGGHRPYTFDISTPTNVTFNDTASQRDGPLEVVSSHYAAEDTPSFDVKVTDDSNASVTKTCAINIQPSSPGALDVECPTSPAYVNTVFHIATVSGGAGPYTYAATLLPPLSLDAGTGLITGASTPGTIKNVSVIVTDKNTTASKVCSIKVVDHQRKSLNCSLLPVGFRECVDYGAARNENINDFWGTNGGFVFFNQIKSIYNGASNSETVSADIGTLNFPMGMQLNIGSNIQAGSVPPVSVSTGTIPTLSPSASAQAAQNMLYGGTIYASAAYPLLAVGGSRITNAGAWGGMIDLSAREGVDVQNFKAGTSTGLTSPSTHSSVGLEGYAQVNSTNLTVGGGTFAGALFVGGSYGYSYTSHEYIRDYGISKPSNRLAQVSAGIILNGVAKIAFSKAFGPSQTYFDGTAAPVPTTATTVNNFKILSFELSYQSAAPGTN